MKIVIAGAGIGGLATALSLHAAGFDDIHVLEAARELRPLGVGLNILPNAVCELAALGLLDDLASQAVATRELVFYNRYGQLIWQEPRGRAAGNTWPQLSIHRGRLQATLATATRVRLGKHAITTDARVTGFTSLPGGSIRVHLTHSGSNSTSHIDTDLLIGADGINSAIRHILYPDEGPPVWNGLIMWRGVAWSTPYLTGESMIVAGDDVQRIVLYPIQHDHHNRQSALINWVLARPGNNTEIQQGDWNRQTRREQVLDHAQQWRCGGVDIPAVIAASAEIFEYPMIDRDPLPRWTFGRVTLLGDAAHPMYPAGSNGATQAIMDARLIAYLLATLGNVDQALQTYDNQRRTTVAGIQLSNRTMGPERVITLAHQRAPHGFTNIRDVIPLHELVHIAANYARIAGFTSRNGTLQSPYNTHVTRPGSTNTPPAKTHESTLGSMPKHGAKATLTNQHISTITEQP